MTGDDNRPIHPMIAEAVKKAQIIWVSVDDSPPGALWCLWIDDAIYVVCGGSEQPDPGLANVDECRVVLRGDHGGRIVEFLAQVTQVTPQCQAWEATASALAAKRLNSTGDTQEHWATDSTIFRLAPQAQPPTTGEALPADSLTASPPPSSAARPTRRPYRLHRVKKRH